MHACTGIYIYIYIYIYLFIYILVYFINMNDGIIRRNGEIVEREIGVCDVFCFVLTPICIPFFSSDYKFFEITPPAPPHPTLLVCCDRERTLRNFSNFFHIADSPKSILIHLINMNNRIIRIYIYIYIYNQYES